MPSSGDAAPRERLDPGQQFAERVGLGEIVVAAGAQALDAVVDFAERAQDQCRGPDFLGAQRADHGQSVALRQHAIDDQHVVGVGPGKLEAGLAVARVFGHVTGLFQRASEEGRSLLIVLDHQHTHGFRISG